MPSTPKEWTQVLTCSWIRSSWNLTNLEPLVCRYSRPPDLLVTHSWLGHMMRGMKEGDWIWGTVKLKWGTADKVSQGLNDFINGANLTGWYVSAPHWSHVYVATAIIGLTSVARVTIPRTVTRFPILSARTSRTTLGLVVVGGLKYSSLWMRNDSQLLNVSEQPQPNYLIQSIRICS